MLRTRVGYAGGTIKKPTYRSIGDHTEAIQIEFDPAVITFDELLEVFLKDHDPFGPQWSTQYKAVLWTHGDTQAKQAKAAMAALQKKAGKKPSTPVVPAPTFWIAEDYHQKYYLRSKRRLIEALLGADAKDDEKIRESTITARVNGWLVGYGTPEEIEADVKRLGITGDAKKALGKALEKRVPALCK